MRNRGKTAAALMLAVLLAGCDGLPTGASGAYLKDIDLSKYVTLGEYTGLSVDVKAPETDEAAQEQYIVSYLNVLAGEAVTDRAARLGDTANIDFAGRLADTDEYFDGGTAEGYNLTLGSGTFIPGFEDGVVGMKIGEKKDIPLTFPESYGAENLAGQDVVFEVTLNSLTGPADADVKEMAIEGVSTVEEYTDYLREEYADRIAEQYRSEIEAALRDKIEANATFQTPPTALLNRLKESYTEQMQILADAYSSAYGQTITVSDLLGMAMSSAGFSGDEDSYVESNAIGTANSYLAVAAIAEEQGISVSDDELLDEMKEHLAGSGYDTLEEYVEASDLEEIREQVLYDKVMDFLYANNKVVGSEAD